MNLELAPLLRAAVLTHGPDPREERRRRPGSATSGALVSLALVGAVQEV